MKMNTYVNFPGNCRQALEFYEKHLGGKTGMASTYNDMPEPKTIPPGLTSDSILHARIAIADTVLMASDGPPERVQPMRSAYLSLSVDSSEEAERVWAALTNGGEIFMALAETFFAHSFGMCRDKFGINWMVIYERPKPASA
jgi:PhnB protein